MVWRVWGEGRPLVLLHGASGSWTHWIRNVLPLAKDFRVLAPDMPGFGDSDAPPEPHTADMLAGAVASGLDVLVPPPVDFDLAGFSFGGIIAGLVAARLGPRVRTLVLLGAGVDDLAVFLQMENIRLARFKSGTIPASDTLLRALPSVRARIASILGGRDAFMAARLEDYRRVLASVEPDLDFRVIAGAGHWAIYEAADEVNRTLGDVLRLNP